MTDNCYTGVGSRFDTPDYILSKFVRIGKKMASNGWILRSGHAEGSDMAFETGCDIMNGKKQIYIPYKGFNGSDSSYYKVTDEAYEIASSIHPKWQYLTKGAQDLHARNTYQVLGLNLNEPSKFMICHTLNGDSKGSTRTAIELARRHGIFTLNLGDSRYSDWTVDEIFSYINDVLRLNL
jgi:hypothetical protein